ncbi:PD-(D/E)XK nuclease family protein [Acidovorax sp. NCPPB 3576]|uniref:PD-(D/E)XK nuclease family protein n=1 Tax=Acidovorax sp. NCPPB 3576 TaxID=2940488 RepID=UPI0023493E02|nr:PD-(D/E)XK nuclease family protein [Acidovorax sp. NCPPB 3576]WCM90608.1 PD-(D/E)XK nuclease family protein [Acidovorax sp. NCPPB 3576]
MTIEQLACRLAGGFSRPIEDEALRAALQQALANTELGELDAIKSLPGMVDACVGTLRKVWAARIDLTGGQHPRLASLAALEAAVMALLPAGMKRPGELVDAALERVQHAPAVFGSVDVLGMTELEPCWRPLFAQVAAVTRVKWIAGPRTAPQWLAEMPLEVVTGSADTPDVRTVSAASALHEAVEAMRWARQLIVSGTARPGEIAVASTSTAEFDDHFLALRSDANLNIHFIHGTKIAASRDGQAAAALADILLRGLTQRRFRRFAALVRSSGGPLAELPEGWLKVLPGDAPLSSSQSWGKLLASLNPESWPNAQDQTPALRAIVEALQAGPAGAEAAGAALLRGRTLNIWKKALAAGPAASLDLTLQSMREDDGLEACESVVWMPAAHLAASPRRFVRLLGLNSSRWPRRASEDRLLSDHIVPSERFEPLPVSEADRRDFETILRTTQRQVMLSFSRRDGEGRLLGLSSLLQGMPLPEYMRRHRRADHAFSESDRLTVRPAEFRDNLQAVSADRCWRAWWQPAITGNDGRIRPEHPVVLAALGRTQSASSLSLLLRNPLGFMWKYGMGLRAPDLSEEPLVLSSLEFGNLVHEVLDAALQATVGQRTRSEPVDISTAVTVGCEQVRIKWEALEPIPPAFIWNRTLHEAMRLATYALEATQLTQPGWTSYSEIPFGGSEPKSDAALPWDAAQEVLIPEADFHIKGYIDRLDSAHRNTHAIVTDYKTGRTPSKDSVLNGGQELQRCLYAFAVKSLLGNAVSVQPSLLYLRGQHSMTMEDPDAVLTALQGYLSTGRTSLTAGNALAGISAAGDYDDLAFALPANAAAGYCKRKKAAVTELMGEATQVWEAE